jgi:hypothetical protein
MSLRSEIEAAARQNDRTAHECRMELDAAVAGLAEASKLLADSVGFSSAEMIESCYATARSAEGRVTTALSAWRDYLSRGSRRSADGSAQTV